MTSALQHLKLVNIRFPWNHGFYSNLFTLEIQHYVPNLHEHSTHDHDMCHVLRDCPRLRKFRLTMKCQGSWDPNFQRVDPRPHSDTKRIRLLFLRSLMIDSPVSYAHHILSSITTTLLSEIVLETSGYSNDAEIACSLPELLPSTAFAQVSMLDHDWYEDPGVLYTGHLHGYSSSKTISVSRPGSAPIFLYSWYIAAPHQAPGPSTNYRIFRALANMLRPMPTITQEARYSVHLPKYLTPRDISTHLRAFSPGDVDVITEANDRRKIEGYSPLSSSHSHNDFIEMETRTPEHTEGDSKLETLSLQYCHFTLRDVYELVQWCMCQTLLRTVRFDSVAFRVPVPHEIGDIRAELRKLNLRVFISFDNCWYSCDGNSGSRKFRWNQ